MPYASDAQRRYFHAAEARGDIKPSVVKDFDQASKGMKLPEHVKKMASGGYTCAHCGGDVDADGYAEGGEVMPTEEKKRAPEETPASRLYAAALQLKGRR